MFRYVVVSQCICISLMTYDVRHLFMCLFAICTSSLVRYVLRSLNQFLAGLFAYWLFPQRAFSLWVLWFQVFCFLSSYLMCRFIFFQYLQNLHKYGETLFSSVQFSLSVVSDCLWPHGLQHAKLQPIPIVNKCGSLLYWFCFCGEPWLIYQCEYSAC